MSTLFEIISAARQMLPDLAEHEAIQSQAVQTNTPSALFEQTRAQAAEQGKSHFTFLGRAVETKGGETFEQLRGRLPQGEMESGGAAMAAGPTSQLIRDQSLRVAREGANAWRQQAKTILSEGLDLTATKSKSVPISEVSQLAAMVEAAKKTKMVTYNYEGVLEREASKKLERALRVMETLKSGKASTVLRGTTASMSTVKTRKGDTGGEY